MNQSHHLRGVGVYRNDVRFKSGPVQRRDTDVVVYAGFEPPASKLAAAGSSLQYIPTETNPFRYSSFTGGKAVHEVGIV